MKDQTLKAARQFILNELSSVYPAEESQALSGIILRESTGLTKTQILVEPEKIISQGARDKIKKICVQLKEFKPIQYVLGKTEFYGLTLRVNEYTLIPRQETEELAALVIRENQGPGLKIIDIGTGSGAIALALYKNIPEVHITATDIVPEALHTARINSELNKCKITFILDDILNSSIAGDRSFDLLVSNPPYIRESEKSAMHRNVLEYEPSSALFVPDSDPLLYYRAIATKARHLLKEGGRLYFEINEALGNETCRLLKDLGLGDIRMTRDINNKDRIVRASVT